MLDGIKTMLYNNVNLQHNNCCFHRHQIDTAYLSCIKNHHDSRHHQRRALKAGVVQDGYWCTTTTPEFQNGKMRFAQFADAANKVINRLNKRQTAN